MPPEVPAVAKIKPAERAAVLNALQAGLVPKIGLHLIQVGRLQEVSAMLRDLETIEQSGGSFRFVIGRFGAGKTFFINLTRNIAMQRKMVVAGADITMERRLYASTGQARALYGQLIHSLATRVRTEGGALRSILDAWINRIQNEVASAGGDTAAVLKRIRSDLSDLAEQPGGYAFVAVLAKYYEAQVAGNDEVQEAALRWLRAEFSTKTEARQTLGVRDIIEDENFYDGLKLMAAFVRKAGFGGLLVTLDEMVVLSHRLPNSRARQSNYEAILRMLNDTLQGGAKGIGFLLGGTDEFLEDPRRGLFSYEALRSRLKESSFVGDGIVDFAGPVVKLKNLTPEELSVLLSRILDVHAGGDSAKRILPAEAIDEYLQYANRTLGAEFFKTPRDAVRGFVQLINAVEQNKGVDWRKLLADGVIQKGAAPLSAEESVQANGAQADEDDFAAFKL
jgi:P-loop Domain of unknown function (DUF2791)